MMDIHEAVKNGDTEAVKKLIDQGADISCEDNYGFTALMEASERGHLDIVKLLVESGADVNRKNKLGWSSLCYAATRRQVQVVKFLVESGADINTDCQGRTLFKWVLQHPTDCQYDENKLLEIIRFLIDNGAVTDSNDMEFAREVHRDMALKNSSGNKSAGDNAKGNVEEGNKIAGMTGYVNSANKNDLRCPHCGADLGTIASGLILQSKQLVDYQTQCPSCKRSISKQDFAPAKTEKKKFWQLWK